MIGKIPLSDMYPELCEEWSDRNLPYTPEMFSYGSNDVVWWRGKCGHEWQAKISGRTHGTGCPYCASIKVLPGFNDLQTLFPDIAAEWSEKNLPLTPSDVMPYSIKKVWWRCGNGHEWEAFVASRAKGYGCPICSNRITVVGINDYATRFPSLLFEWSEKNPMKFSDVRAKDAHKRYWWKCPDCGNEYQKALVRKLDSPGCPYCARRKVKTGFSDLATTDPDIAAEWNAALNGEWTPRDVTRRSRKFIRWNCDCGHIWGCKISERTLSGKTCVICDAEFRAVLPLWLMVSAAHRNSLKIEINRVISGMHLQLYFPELQAAAEEAGCSVQYIVEREYTPAPFETRLDVLKADIEYYKNVMK
ncbi:MAG: zinc-ribbon domain-containing protein [Blautia sp.]|nr:zinc-ribbon domain-containing protein [Blautia sp.]